MHWEWILTEDKMLLNWSDKVSVHGFDKFPDTWNEETSSIFWYILCNTLQNWNRKCGLNPLSANFTKWSNTQQFVGKLPTSCLSVFDHFVELALKGLKLMMKIHARWSLFNWMYMHVVKRSYGPVISVSVISGVSLIESHCFHWS